MNFENPSEIFSCQSNEIIEKSYFFFIAAQPQKANENNKGPSKAAGKKKSDDKASAASTGMFSRFLGKIGIKAPSRAHLPEDKDQSIVWDEKTKVNCFLKYIYISEFDNLLFVSYNEILRKYIVLKLFLSTIKDVFYCLCLALDRQEC